MVVPRSWQSARNSPGHSPWQGSSAHDFLAAANLQRPDVARNDAVDILMARTVEHRLDQATRIGRRTMRDHEQLLHNLSYLPGLSPMVGAMARGGNAGSPGPLYPPPLPYPAKGTITVRRAPTGH